MPFTCSSVKILQHFLSICINWNTIIAFCVPLIALIDTMNYIYIYFRCRYIALGNGTACRETEKLLTDVVAGTATTYWCVYDL